jgi:wobble nucleotide-excising tRNase
VTEVPLPPAGVDESLSVCSELLAETPSQVAIQALESKPTAQAWVEQGLALHEGLDQCLFCAGKVTSDRYAQLRRHFDESWLQIRGKAKNLLMAITREKQALTAWH